VDFEVRERHGGMIAHVIGWLRIPNLGQRGRPITLVL
jgi:hypothetical protein